MMPQPDQDRRPEATFRTNTVVGGTSVIRLYWAIRPNGLVYGPVTKVPTNHPADWVIIHTDGIPEERDAS